MATSTDVPTDTILIWETAAQALKKVEQRIGRQPFTPAFRSELLAALLTAVDDAWEEHIMQRSRIEPKLRRSSLGDLALLSHPNGMVRTGAAGPWNLAGPLGPRRLSQQSGP